MRSPSGARHWLVIAVVVTVVLVGSAALARALLPLRSILGLETRAAGCTPSLTSSRFPDNAASPAGRWRLVGSYPEGRDEVRAAAVGGRIYVGTGADRAAVADLEAVAELFEFDPERKRYRNVPPVPVAVDHAAFVGHEGALYVFGGYVERRAVLVGMAVLAEHGRWEELAPMRSRARFAGGGGRRRSDLRRRRQSAGARNRRERCPLSRSTTSASGTWGRGPDMPTPRHHHGAAAINGRLVVVGGRGEDDLSSDAVEQFDPARGRWTTLPPLPLGAGGLALVATPRFVIAVGGGDDEEHWVTPAAWALAPGAETSGFAWPTSTSRDTGTVRRRSARASSSSPARHAPALANPRSSSSSIRHTSKPRAERVQLAGGGTLSRRAAFSRMNATRSRSCCLFMVRP